PGLVHVILPVGEHAGQHLPALVDHEEQLLHVRARLSWHELDHLPGRQAFGTRGGPDGEAIEQLPFPEEEGEFGRHLIHAESALHLGLIVLRLPVSQLISVYDDQPSVVVLPTATYSISD